MPCAVCLAACLASSRIMFACVQLACFGKSFGHMHCSCLPLADGAHGCHRLCTSAIGDWNALKLLSCVWASHRYSLQNAFTGPPRRREQPRAQRWSAQEADPKACAHLHFAQMRFEVAGVKVNGRLQRTQVVEVNF